MRRGCGRCTPRSACASAPSCRPTPPPSAPRGYALRHHLLHRQGTGVRLPARRPRAGDRATAAAGGRALRAAGTRRAPVLRGLCMAIVDEADSDPDRRGAGAADPVAAPATMAEAARSCRQALRYARTLAARRRLHARAGDRARAADGTGPAASARAAAVAGRRLHRGRVAQSPRIASTRSALRWRRCTCTARDRHYLVRDGKVADHRRDHRPRRRRPRLVATACSS